jgi:hypothetical protein
LGQQLAVRPAFSRTPLAAVVLRPKAQRILCENDASQRTFMFATSFSKEPIGGQNARS